MMNKKKNFLVFSFLWLILLCFCEENTGDWTLVPQYFSGNEVYKEIIPTLILKSFPENISRVLTYEEEEFLNLKNLEKEKKAKEIKKVVPATYTHTSSKNDFDNEDEELPF